MDDALIRKFRFKPGMRGAIVNAPREYAGPAKGGGLMIVPKGRELDFVHLFVQSVAQIEKLFPKARRMLKHDGLLWISYPKHSAGIRTDISRDRGWRVVIQAGFEGVAQIAIDDTWSALRFRLKELVGR